MGVPQRTPGAGKSHIGKIARGPGLSGSSAKPCREASLSRVAGAYLLDAITRRYSQEPLRVILSPSETFWHHLCPHGVLIAAESITGTFPVAARPGARCTTIVSGAIPWPATVRVRSHSPPGHHHQWTARSDAG